MVGIRRRNLRVAKLDKDLQKAIFKIAVRDEIIKQRLGIDMPNPFP
jgi:hypothetical protein